MAAGCNLEPMRCIYCGSHEISYNQGLRDAQCGDCGLWQIFNAKFHYLTNCVSCGDGDAISEMVEQAEQITWKTLLRHVPFDEIREVFPTYSYHKEHYNPKTGEIVMSKSIKDDWAVSFWKSSFRKKLCYYIDHSGIEYIFTREGEN